MRALKGSLKLIVPAVTAALVAVKAVVSEASDMRCKKAVVAVLVAGIAICKVLAIALAYF